MIDRLIRTLVAVSIGGMAFGVSMLTWSFARQCTGMGLAYQAMSVAPFEFLGDHPHRILMPLIAHLVRLDGDRYWIFCHLCNVVFLAVVYAACRRLQAKWIDAVLVTTAIALSGTVVLYSTWLMGFSDTVTFTLLLATLLAVRRGGWCWGLHFLNLLNHEQVFFFTPLILYLRWHLVRPTVLREAIALLSLLVAYAGFRMLISCVAKDEKLTASFYLQLSHFPWGFLGLSVLAIADSLILFGPLLLLVFWAAWQPRHRFENRAALLIPMAILGMLTIAYDFPRFVCFVFLPVGAASLRFLHGGRRRVWFVALIVAYVATAQQMNAHVVPTIAAAMAECGVLDNPMAFGTCVVPKTVDVLLWLWLAVAIGVMATRWIARWLPALDLALPGADRAQ